MLGTLVHFIWGRRANSHFGSRNSQNGSRGVKRETKGGKSGAVQWAPVNHRIGNGNASVLRGLPIARLAGALRFRVRSLFYDSLVLKAD